MGRVDDRRPLAETACLGEKLDRADAVLRHALLDLTGLLAGVHVENEVLRLGEACDLDEPLARACSDGVGGEPDRDAILAQALDFLEIRRHRRLPHALDPAAGVCDMEADERKPGRLGRLGSCPGGLEPEVVELADRGDPGRTHLPICALVQ